MQKARTHTQNPRVYSGKHINCNSGEGAKSVAEKEEFYPLQLCPSLPGGARPCPPSPPIPSEKDFINIHDSLPHTTHHHSISPKPKEDPKIGLDTCQKNARKPTHHNAQNFSCVYLRKTTQLVVRSGERVEGGGWVGGLLKFEVLLK